MMIACISGHKLASLCADFPPVLLVATGPVVPKKLNSTLFSGTRQQLPRMWVVRRIVSSLRRGCDRARRVPTWLPIRRFGKGLGGEKSSRQK
jgi:hypothetical protein